MILEFQGATTDFTEVKNITSNLKRFRVCLCPQWILLNRIGTYLFSTMIFLISHDIQSIMATVEVMRFSNISFWHWTICGLNHTSSSNYNNFRPFVRVVMGVIKIERQTDGRGDRQTDTDQKFFLLSKTQYIANIFHFTGHQ